MLYNYFNLKNQNEDFIDTFFEMGSAGEQEGQEDLILPDCTHGLLYIQQGNIYRQNESEMSSLSAGTFYLLGQKTKLVSYQFDQKAIKAFGLKLKPAAISELFDISAHEITDKIIDLKDLNDRDELEMLQDDSLGSKERFDLLNRIFRRRSNLPKQDTSKLLDLLLSDIHQSNGLISIMELSKKYNLSYKRIERLFKQHVGLTPKYYTRIIRFNSCIKHAFESNETKLTDLAYRGGFFDQTHFIKETKQLTGQLPSAIFGDRSVSLEKEQISYLLQRNY